MNLSGVWHLRWPEPWKVLTWAIPDFRVNGKSFATLHHNYKFGMVKLTPEQQRFVRDYPDVFAPEKGAWGRAGSTAVCLDSVSDDTLGEAITLAWQNNVAKSAASKNGTRPRPKTKSRKR